MRPGPPLILLSGCSAITNSSAPGWCSVSPALTRMPQTVLAVTATRTSGLYGSAHTRDEPA
jgi:hypothetical protein